jgi:hypothetical protein
MKRICILVCSLALVATAGFALSPSDAPVTLEAIFTSPAPISAAVVAKATCTANCGGTATVSCSYTPPATCVAVDRNCPSQRGYVSCNGATTYCPATCTEPCTEGAIKNVTTGPNCSCEDGMSTPKDRYKCIGGTWVYQFSFCGGPFCTGGVQ